MAARASRPRRLLYRILLPVARWQRRHTGSSAVIAELDKAIAQMEAGR